MHFISNSWCYVCNFVNADRETCCLQWGGKSPKYAMKPFVCCGSVCPALPVTPGMPCEAVNGVVASNMYRHPFQRSLLLRIKA